MASYNVELGQIAYQAVIKKFRSVNNAANSIPVDRHTLDKFTKHGRIPQQPVFDRIARAVEADVPAWRRMAGYEVGENPNDRYRRLLGALMDHCAQLGIEQPVVIRNAFGAECPDIETADRAIRSTVERNAEEYPDHAKELRAWAEREVPDAA